MVSALGKKGRGKSIGRGSLEAEGILYPTQVSYTTLSGNVKTVYILFLIIKRCLHFRTQRFTNSITPHRGGSIDFAGLIGRGSWCSLSSCFLWVFGQDICWFATPLLNTRTPRPSTRPERRWTTNLCLPWGGGAASRKAGWRKVRARTEA